MVSPTDTRPRVPVGKYEKSAEGKTDSHVGLISPPWNDTVGAIHESPDYSGGID